MGLTQRGAEKLRRRKDRSEVRFAEESMQERDVTRRSSGFVGGCPSSTGRSSFQRGSLFRKTSEVHSSTGRRRWISSRQSARGAPVRRTCTAPFTTSRGCRQGRPLWGQAARSRLPRSPLNAFPLFVGTASLTFVQKSTPLSIPSRGTDFGSATCNARP